jgi:hypothetical protein
MMRDLLIGEFQDGHALVRLMFMTALVAASWFMFRPEMKKPPGGDKTERLEGFPEENYRPVAGGRQRSSTTP